MAITQRENERVIRVPEAVRLLESPYPNRGEKMDTLRFVAERGSERFEIIEGNGEGFYVFRYLQGQQTHDYLQNDVPMAYRCAEHQWELPPSAWRPALPGERPLWQKTT